MTCLQTESITTAFEIEGEYDLGDITAIYFRRSGDKRVSLLIVPSAHRGRVVARRDDLDNVELLNLGCDDLAAWRTDSIVQFRTTRPGYGSGLDTGLTLRNGPDVDSLTLDSQSLAESQTSTIITTSLFSDTGLTFEHKLIHRRSTPWLSIETSVSNCGDRDVTLEMLSSFSLSGVTPFDPAHAPERLRVHRFRSYWSAEGRKVTDTLEALHLGRSWAPFVAFSERFGQTGTMPTRQWFPIVALEDSAKDVVWAAQVGWSGSWQMEIYRRDDTVNLSGGLADKEFGRWTKVLRPGESLTAPAAVVTCCHGTIDDACQRLAESQMHTADTVPAHEQDLPVVFNDWCSNWGDPHHERLLAQARAVAGRGIRYFVIDSGWFTGESGDTRQCLGDWLARTDIYPQGLDATINAIHELGLVPGLWFEIETVTSNSEAYHRFADMMVKIDGEPIDSGGRRFWDLRRQAVIERLVNTMVSAIDRYRLGYIKIDYNACLPMGIDGTQSPGEELRQHVSGIHRLFDLLREMRPDVVIENCASGGHRLDPSLVSRASLQSFSDAHECPEIPTIAANMHRLIRPEQSLAWAVIRQGDSLQRIYYSMVAALLGRPCLSGDVDRLSSVQWAAVEEALVFYHRVKNVIAHGNTRWHGAVQQSYRDLKGIQLIERTLPDGREKLIVAHRFAGSSPDIFLPTEGNWHISRSLHLPSDSASITDNNMVHIRMADEFSGVAVFLKESNYTNASNDLCV